MKQNIDKPTIAVVIMLFILFVLIGFFKKDNYDTDTIKKEELKAHKEDSIKKAKEPKPKLINKDSIIKSWQKKFRYEYDEFEKTGFYYSWNAPSYSNVNFIHPYIGVDKNKNAWVITRFCYEAESWLFIRSLSLLIDGTKFDYSINFKRDVSGVRIYEHADANTEEFDLDVLRYMGESKVCKIRYNGDNHYVDRTLTETEKSVIKSILKAYDSFSDKN